MSQSTGKIMAALIYDAHGLMFLDYIEECKTVDSEYNIYCVFGVFEGRKCEKNYVK